MSDKKKRLIKKGKKTAKKIISGEVRSFVRGAIRGASRRKDSEHVKGVRRRSRVPRADISVGKTFTLGGKKKARQMKKIKKWKAEAAAGKKTEQQKFLEMDKKNK